MYGLKVVAILMVFLFQSLYANQMTQKKLVYIASDRTIPFWQIMGKGVTFASKEYGYNVELLGSQNSAQTELQHVVKAIQEKVDGLIISPTNSSRCVTILKLAQQANIPVVILDIGTDGGEYLSYISANNKQGAYEIGQVLAKKMKAMHYEEGTVGIIGIPQKRINGQLRTAGFMQAMEEAGIKTADIKQQVDFSLKETYLLAKEIITKHKNIKALWLQGSDKYKGALQAIKESQRDILLLTFDAEPEFIDLISEGVLVGAAMQQPFLMGQEAVKMMHNHFNNIKVEKNIQLPILAISNDNVKEKTPLIKRNVLGLEVE